MLADVRLMCSSFLLVNKCPMSKRVLKGHVNNVPTMQLITGISRNTQSKSYKYAIID